MYMNRVMEASLRIWLLPALNGEMSDLNLNESEISVQRSHLCHAHQRLSLFVFFLYYIIDLAHLGELNFWFCPRSG